MKEASSTFAGLAEVCRDQGIPAAAAFASVGSSEVHSASVGTGTAGCDAVFPACSLSKGPFVCVVAQLVLNGQLTLETTLGELLHIGDIQAAVLPDHVPIVAACTVRDVLSHRTGLPNWRIGAMVENARCELRAPPGGIFSYSGEAQILLQLGIQRLTGRSLQALAQSIVFEPLQMKNSSFVWREDFEAGGKSAAMTPTPPGHEARQDNTWRPRAPVVSAALPAAAVCVLGTALCCVLQ